MRSLWLISLLLPAAAAAQTEPAIAPTSPLPIETTVISFGIDRHDRMTVPVTIGGTGDYRFVIDTGAERTVVSSQLARKLGLKSGRKANLVSISGQGLVSTVIVPSIEVSGRATMGIVAPSLDDTHIGAAGILGLDTLGDRRILLDFKAGRMSISASDKIEERWDPDTIVVKARRRFGQLILVDSSIDGRSIKVIIDTGAEVSLGNSALLKRLSARRMRSAQPITLTSVTGGTVVAQWAQLAEIKIGGITLNNLPVAFADIEPFRKFGLGDTPALLLGMDALRLFDRVSVDFANKQVRFLKPDGASRATDERLARRDGVANTGA